MSLDTSRTEYILGKDGCRRLAEAHVLVFGVGGVGGHLCEALARAGVGAISSMGAGNTLYPERFRVSDIYETSVCPLARVMRRELKARGISALTVVWSDEPPIAPKVAVEGRAPGSISFVPAAAGLVMAGEIVRRLAL